MRARLARWLFELAYRIGRDPVFEVSGNTFENVAVTVAVR